MKKVLSVLLAAATVAGMSVSSFAAEYSVVSTGTEKIELANLDWSVVYQVRDGKLAGKANPDASNVIDELAIEEGDDLYFSFTIDKVGDGTAEHIVPTVMPNNWIVKINNAEYIEDAELVQVTKKNIEKWGVAFPEGQVLVKVTVAEDFNAKDLNRVDDEEAVEFWMYIKDKSNDFESEKAKVHYYMAAYPVVYLCESDVKDVVEAKEETLYALYDGTNNTKCTESCDHKSALVVFDFDGVLVKAKLYKGDEYLVKDSTAFKFEKELSQKYDTDIDVVTFDTELDVREVIFEAAKDNKQVVAVVDGALVPVDSEFVTKYEVIKNVELSKGYIADIDANAVAYALVSTDLEVEVEAEEEPVEADKANPETGAADFVGAAVAMAVVSVAAAGALALKK